MSLQLSFWKEPTTISEPVDLMVSAENQSNFSSLMKSHEITYETWIDNVEQLLIKSNHRISVSILYTRVNLKKKGIFLLT